MVTLFFFRGVCGYGLISSKVNSLTKDSRKEGTNDQIGLRRSKLNESRQDSKARHKESCTTKLQLQTYSVRSSRKVILVLNQILKDTT